jgi:hypothetical protein
MDKLEHNKQKTLLSRIFNSLRRFVQKFV